MTPTVEPVRKTVVVDAGVDRAFATFVERFDAIKPREHNLLPVQIATTIFEPRVGGNIYDLGVDGSRCNWARVLVYDPPLRLVFSWDIGTTWQLETDLDRTSEVEVRFIAESADRTRVELTHRNLERHGPDWPSTADALDGDHGWPVYLSRYVELVRPR